jgi:hypothetical protein
VCDINMNDRVVGTAAEPRPQRRPHWRDPARDAGSAPPPAGDQPAATAEATDGNRLSRLPALASHQRLPLRYHKALPAPRQSYPAQQQLQLLQQRQPVHTDHRIAETFHLPQRPEHWPPSHPHPRPRPRASAVRPPLRPAAGRLPLRWRHGLPPAPTAAWLVRWRLGTSRLLLCRPYPCILRSLADSFPAGPAQLRMRVVKSRLADQARGTDVCCMCVCKLCAIYSIRTATANRTVRW